MIAIFTNLSTIYTCKFLNMACRYSSTVVSFVILFVDFPWFTDTVFLDKIFLKKCIGSKETHDR